MRKGIGGALAFACVLGLGLAAAQPARAVTEAEVRGAVEKTFGVKVLKIREAHVGSERAYAVTVMSQAGDYNGALGVTTLMVDADSGKLLSAFRHLASGYTLPDAGEHDPNRQPEDAARIGVWR